MVRFARIGSLMVSAMLILGMLDRPPAAAQAPTPVYGNGPIPDSPFTSWSLFLMCNPEWLLKKQEPILRSVFEAYLAFALTTGRRHAAVWFVKPKPAGNGPPWANPENIDVERSVYYCQRFKLDPSEGPHIVVTTTHPDRWAPGTPSPGANGDSFVLLALGGSEPDDIVRLLKKLNDQVLVEKLSQRELDSAQYWQSWVRVLESACRFFDKVKFTVRAKIVDVEKTGLCT
jgi:hypothetical protein